MRDRLPRAEAGAVVLRPRPRHRGQLVAELAEHLLPRATAAARPRPGSSARPARSRPSPRAAAASSAQSRLLPMPGSPVTTAKAGWSPGWSSSPTSAASWSSRPTSGQGDSVGPAGATGSAGAADHRRSAGSPRRLVPLQRRILLQQGGLQGAQLRARLEPELLGEQRRAPGAAPRARRPVGPRGSARGHAGPTAVHAAGTSRSAPRARPRPSHDAPARERPRPGPRARSPGAPRGGLARPAPREHPRARRTAPRATGTTPR